MAGIFRTSTSTASAIALWGFAAFSLLLVIAVPGVGSKIFYVVLAAACGLAANRMSRMRVVVDGDKVRVINFWRTHVLDRSDLKELGTRPLPVNPGVAAHWVSMDGSGTHLMGIGLGNSPGTKTWQQGAQELARLRDYLELESSTALGAEATYRSSPRVRVMQWSVGIGAMLVLIGVAASGGEIGGLAAFLGLGGGWLILMLGRADQRRRGASAPDRAATERDESS